jgi:pimeloyl-ACP methyl ester carboxylesterase
VVCKQYEPEIIIGHSVGGMASVFYQNKYKLENLEKMVLLGAPSEFKTILKSYTDLLSYNEKVVRSLDKLIHDTFGAPPGDFSTAKFAQSLNGVKGLIIHDKKDKIISYSDAELIHKNFQNSQLISTSGFGHSLNNKEVYNHIVNFINN